ncbi:MAG: endonuclease domain-containing protein [Clostridia bacterium]|nr:endonuclease domain-containing protein [Clostridia bacterium]
MKNYNKDNLSLARELRRNMTPWERKLWYEFLHSYPVRFRRQATLGDYIADFYCTKAKLVIELDGGHHYIQKNEQRDFIRTSEIESLDIDVIRVCNLDIDKNFYGVCEYIDSEVKKRIE